MSKPSLFAWEQGVDNRFNTSVDQSFEDLVGDTEQGDGTVALWVLYRLLYLTTVNMHVSFQLQELLFSSHYTDGDYPTDADRLSLMAERVGLNKEQVKSYISNSENQNKLKQKARSWSANGVSGTSCFLMPNNFLHRILVSKINLLLDYVVEVLWGISA